MNREMTELYARRAVIHYNRGDYASAIDDLDKAIERQPTNPKLYYGRGAMFRKIGNYEAPFSRCALRAGKRLLCNR